MKLNSGLVKFFDIFNQRSSLLFGVFLLLIGAQNLNFFISGISVILGTLAYKSAKNRKLGITKASIFNQVLEITSFILIVLLVSWKNDLKRIIVNDPVPNIAIPAWLITAYLTVVFYEYFNFKKI